MKLNYKDTTRYIFKCPFCNIRVPKFIIDFNKCNISIECRCTYKKQSIGLESVSKIIEKTKYSKFFYKICKNILNFDFDNYICNDRNKISHIGHSIKSFTIPNQKQREFYRLNMDEYNNKITKLINNIKNICLFNEHYYIMNKYLKCLLIIN